MGHLPDPTATNPTEAANDFHLADDHGALSDVLDGGLLGKCLTTVYWCFGACGSWQWIILNTWNDEQCLQNFCMCWATFMNIVAKLTPNVEWQDIAKRPPMTLEKCVTIWKLAISNSI
ncbi:hypothetical protein Y1Q_0020662 [Alligator mississippiensis]|nr:hypothetical protein Y1Q_0020662 [Alligator mississippiensis]